MIPLLLLASVPPMLWGMQSGAPAAADTMVQDARNGEFLWRYYPQGALKRGEQGRVGFKLTIEPTGTIGACDVTQSSGFKALDAETCEIMALYARVQPVRNAEGRAIRASQDGFINWKLPPGATTKLASASTAKTMPGPDKLICRKDITTGSLIATTRQCLKASEWKRQEQITRDAIDRIQGKGYCDGRGGPCNPGG
jgi:TonB family protein